MATRKLTLSMIAALEAAAKRDVDFYELMKVGASGATTSSLVTHGLLTDRRCANGRLWSITDEGRAALAAVREGQPR